MDDSVISFWFREVVMIVSDYLLYASATFFIFYIVLKKPMWFRKVQKKMPALSDYGRDIFYSLISVSIFASVAVIVFFFLNSYTHTYDQISEYGWTYYIFSWVWMLFIHDTYFYWVHRLMHHPFFFKHIHLIHHKSTNPSPWTAYAFHPFEAVLEVGILPIIAFTLPVHQYAIGWFFLFQIIYNVYGHLGFELFPKRFHKTMVGRWINTSVAHNLHHKKFDGNYGLYFLFWDRMMGTIRKDYDRTYEVTTERNVETGLSPSKNNPA